VLTTPNYAFANAWHREWERLTGIEWALDPTTISLLSTLDIERGWRCLEVGPGAGSIARWLCRCATDGGVVALDVDTRFVDAIQEPNLEVRRADLTVADLDTRTFDLVHARLVLEHIPARLAVLGRLREALKPGGVMVIEANDFLSFGVPGPDTEQVMQALEHIAARIGWDLHFGRRVPSALQAAGLRDVVAAGHIRFFPGKSPLARSIQLSFEELRPQFARDGVAEDVIDRVIAACESETELVMPPLIVQAWGRR
jgi:SAM-dependent methyltransferase